MRIKAVMERKRSRGLRYHSEDGENAPIKEIGRFRAIRWYVPKEREPLILKKGDLVNCIREDDEYKGWFFCEKGGRKGWVPVGLVELIGELNGRIKEDYSSQELELEAGDEVEGLRVMSGWLWGKKVKTGEIGWVPLDNLREMKSIAV